MIRVLIGAVPAAIAMFVIGFLFFATPLAKIGTSSLDNARAAAVQQSLAANIPATGTYAVPDVDTREQTNMYSRGPIATIHYNSKGYAAMEPGSLLGGLLLNFVTALLIGLALIGIDRRVPDFASRAKTVVFIALAAGLYMHLGEPIYYHHDWRHFIYLFVGDTAALIAAGLIIARWFLPKGESAVAAQTH
jgi:hypothetical protein